MKNPDSKQRLIEVMTRLDKTFKPQLNEEFGAGTDDPTKEEMVGFLTNKFQGLVDPMETDANNFDIESAIYWFGNDYHGGQNSNLYSALSTSEYRPGPMHKSVEDDESETATMMYQELVDKYGGSAQEDPIDAGNTQWHGIEMNEDPIGEVFGWSGKEKESKANTETINNAKAEITKYPPSHLFGQPGRNSAPADDKQLMSTRLNMAKQNMPTLAELMPQLFDLTQGYGDMVQIYNGKPLKGLVPSNWYYFLRGEEGYVDNEQAVRKLNQEIDNLGQQMGLQEDISVDVKVGDTIMTGRFKNKRTVVKSIGKDEHGMPTINGKKVVTFRKGIEENIHNTAQMGGILNSKGTAGYNPDATNEPNTWDKDITPSNHAQFILQAKEMGITPQELYGQMQGEERNDDAKRGIGEDEGVIEAIVGDNPEEYRSKAEKLKQTIDKLFSEEYYDVIDTLFRLLVTRGKGDGQIASLRENTDAISTGHNIYKDVMTLINHQAGDEVWSGGAVSALKFYENVLEGIRDALYQDLGDSVNKNAGAAPDEIQ